MRNLLDTHPLAHALIWIAVYIVAVNIGDAVGELLAFPSLTGILLIVLSVVLVVSLRGARRLAFFGLRRVQPGRGRSTLWYVPLFAIVLVPYVNGFAVGLDAPRVLSALLLVAGVAFVEELLFRGFLLQALRSQGSTTSAILISGVTFGVGHVVNLLRGYALAEQLLQIVAAVVIGIALAYCAVLTGSILPGIVFHALFNLGAALTPSTVRADAITVAVIAVVMIPYVLFLRARFARVGPALDSPPASVS